MNTPKIKTAGKFSIQHSAEDEFLEKDQDSLSDDFFIYDEDDSAEGVDNEVEEESELPPRVEKRIIIQHCCNQADFANKVWTAFITLHLFLIPSIIGLLMGLLICVDDGTTEDPFKVIKQNLIIGFIGASVFLGLPFHAIALVDLEEAVEDIRLSRRRQESFNNSFFEAQDQNEDVTPSMAKGDNIQRAIAAGP